MAALIDGGGITSNTGDLLIRDGCVLALGYQSLNIHGVLRVLVGRPGSTLRTLLALYPAIDKRIQRVG